MTVILGLLIVISHNIWVQDWRIIITMLGWFVLISGLVRLIYPNTARQVVAKFISFPVRMYIAGGVWLLLGVFLLFKAYY